MEKDFLICAVLVALAGAASDVRNARIPNWLTYSSLVAALLARAILMGWSGLGLGLVGMGVAGGAFFVLFLLGGMGGGDVKLMAAVAAWAGSGEVMAILLSAAIAGGILAIAYMVFGHRIRQTLLNTLELISHHLVSGLQPHPSLNVRGPGSTRVPYGVAIAIGTMYRAGRAIWWG